MDDEHVIWLFVVALVLIVALWGGRQVMQQVGTDGEDVFRQWFWETRSMDLFIQAGLIFGGALGIAALLPRANEEDEGE